LCVPHVRNSPLNFIDPTGHREAGASQNDLLPYEAPVPIPKLRDVHPSIDPVFSGLPIVDPSWVNGFGASKYAFEHRKIYEPSSTGLHGAIDFGKSYDPNCRECMLVYANVTGTVVIGQFPEDASPNVVIDLGNGMFAVFGHVTSTVAKDTLVHPGDVIGELVDLRKWNPDGTLQIDNTHVHMELRTLERTFNPAYFFTDPSILQSFTWDYSPYQSLYSISSYLYKSGVSYWKAPGWKFGLTE